MGDPDIGFGTKDFGKFFPFRAIGERGKMFSSATSTLWSRFSVGTFPRVVELGTMPAFPLEFAEGGFVSESLAAKALCHCLSFFQVLDFYPEVQDTSQV